MRVNIAKLKHHQTESFSFPNIEAELSDEVIDEHKMRPALKRIGRALAKQMQERYPSLVAVRLHTLDFNMIFAGTRKTPCEHRLRGSNHPDAINGHCGHCEAFRVKSKKTAK